VFGWNPASARVLEKAGYVLEGRLRQAVTKDGQVTDLLVYGWCARVNALDRQRTSHCVFS